MLLFMIVVAVKGRVEFGPDRNPSSPGVQQQSPFAVVVVATGPAPLFDPQARAGPGPFVVQEGDRSPRAAGRPSWGDRHALFLAERPPDSLRVGPFTRGARADVQVLHKGRRWFAVRLDEAGTATDPNGMLSVWPVPEGDDESRDEELNR